MIPVEHPHIFVAAVTHPGMKGKNNEDRYKVSAYQTGGDEGTPSLLLVISDGIGGHRAGEVAAEMAVNIITQKVSEGDPGQPLEVLRAAAAEASQSIAAQSEREDSQRGMGATCVCAWIIDDRLYVGSMGDSRLYLARGDAIRQLTVDHTWIQEAIEHGALTPEQAADHPNAHVIRRYMGSDAPAELDLRLRLRDHEKNSQSEAHQGLRLQPGDRLLLCTDGLTDLVKDGEILTVLQALPREQALTKLVNMANARGGHDNITAILAEVPLSQAAETPKSGEWPAWALAAGCVGLLIITALLVASAILGWWFFSSAWPGS